ncbi:MULTISPECIES: XrtA system polysaccharide chain length determinant [unclassified Massilia]|uniref:XrtA system polysaccharide chain length determinant n=1 Tax=unclassified Massilia TaxID=2609279 RepID=UPI001B82475B|nr:MULTISPECIES: XrtA system polysaccharide chain length determinant [unclassified Massilia]MBQ5940880.1 chain length-determining protein [Massilia sp. AB1]MBQ5964541.1 chain length-determining protein [Massilia sp. ZL223]
MAEITALILTFLKAIGKYRWHAVVITWVVALAGWAVVFKLPNQYEVSSRVYVDTQSILKPLLSNMTTVPNLDQQVLFMRRTLISRPNVERVMRMVDLDVKARDSKEQEKMVDDMISRIKIAGTERDDIYTITYTAPSAKEGKDVVQAFLTIFVEGSFGGKKQDSEKAVQFIDDQIKSYEEKLATAENTLKEFKIKNVGMLPREGADFGSRMIAANEALSQARLELAEAEQGRNAIRRQISGGSGAKGGASPSLPYVDPALEERIATVTKTLDSLRTQFTEQHPDIVANRRLLEQLQARKEEQAKNRKPSADPGASYSPMLQQLTVALSEADARVASLQARVAEYSARVAQLRNQSAQAPEVEAQLAQLNRDYEVNRENYQKLVERRESAKLSGDLSSATDMLTFRVIEPPTAPPVPSGPNRLRLFSAVFVAALAAGLAGAFLMSQLRPTFLSHAALREVTGVPILGSISMNWTAEQTVRRKRRLVALGVSVLVLFSAYGAGVAAILVRPNM